MLFSDGFQLAEKVGPPPSPLQELDNRVYGREDDGNEKKAE
jgi:hypothetical protein